jgi:hypothetical protein
MEGNMIKAQVQDGIVTNVIVVDPNGIPDWCVDWPNADENAEVGGTYDGQSFKRRPLMPLPPPAREEQEVARKAAYQVEADPLFFKAQRGEATMEEWTAKVAEIKALFPYPAV